jgi:hypothetical protein
MSITQSTRVLRKKSSEPIEAKVLASSNITKKPIKVVKKYKKRAIKQANIILAQSTDSRRESVCKTKIERENEVLNTLVNLQQKQIQELKEANNKVAKYLELGNFRLKALKDGQSESQRENELLQTLVNNQQKQIETLKEASNKLASHLELGTNIDEDLEDNEVLQMMFITFMHRI